VAVAGIAPLLRKATRPDTTSSSAPHTPELVSTRYLGTSSNPRLLDIPCICIDTLDSTRGSPTTGLVIEFVLASLRQANCRSG
jgi:hypothetical protein